MNRFVPAAALHRIVVMATLAAATLAAATLAAAFAAGAPGPGVAQDTTHIADEVLASVLRQSIGAPARASLGPQATERLSGDLVIVPGEAAGQLLAATGQAVPPDFVALLLGPAGMRSAGLVRFIPAGFIDADAALAFTPENLFSSLNNTIERGNAERLKQGLPEQEARRWIEPPRYNPETHQLAWAALIVPKTAPRDSDGETTYYALGFGREGYVQVSVVSSMQEADQIIEMTDSFLAGLSFEPGKAYGDAQPADPRAQGGLAAAIGLDSLDPAPISSSLWAGDGVVPIAGGIVAGIGGLALLFYVQRYLRSEARRG